ncbi:hypothetical protein, conserved [Eimeria tenella]|uniref:Peptidase C1A papain C-terminal domain-containing protein n=1 Tax=Eimeria tenella TaxID=5802 RepID=U6KI41_EIMTE|nr:hypothetical protein, conserved [Eimeria tenella]CDJ37609.1 hypothetical protein, conserved [Eimeria tenella]|eukprot:XP_013228447.1 hypothetical protein, conserved [Eimeria tenella]
MQTQDARHDHPQVLGGSQVSGSLACCACDAQPLTLPRSTWGNDWGRNGYIKMKRGENLAAIESQAVAIDPDLRRGRAALLVQQLRAQAASQQQQSAAA